MDKIQIIPFTAAGDKPTFFQTAQQHAFDICDLFAF
jgi:hypothetical protein